LISGHPGVEHRLTEGLTRSPILVTDEAATVFQDE
jgi:hypothetical protein